MAQLSLRQAREFHDATETIRRIAREVQEGKS